MHTNPRKKKRIRIGVNKYKEHWRHVQYETDEQMARAFFKGPEYAAYLDRGGKAFKEDIFYEMKCACIEHSTFDECACSTCTEAMETVRDWDRQRRVWFKDDTECGACNGACAAKSPYRLASRSWSALRAFVHVPCNKEHLEDLMICPGSSERVEMYRRQCCRVPLPELKQALRARERADAADAFCNELDTELAEAKRLESPAAAIKKCEQSAARAQKFEARAAAKASKTALDAGGYTAEDVRQLALLQQVRMGQAHAHVSDRMG